MVVGAAERKRIQDETDAIKAECLEMFLPFRDGLIARLTEFSEEATEKGLRGVRKVRQEAIGENCLKVSTCLNGIGMVLVAGGDASLRDRATEDIYACKIMVYPDDEPSSEPWLEVYVQRIDKGAFSFNVEQLGKDKFPIGGSHQQPNVGEYDGRRAADILIDYYYGFRFCWRDRPTLAAMAGGNTREPIGFRTDRER